MGYDEERVARRRLTPLESELRASARVTEPWQESARGPWPRFREWRRSRRPPRTLRAAVALGLLRMGVALAVCSVLALLVARWMDRDTAIGFYIVGAATLLVAFLFSAADMGSPYYADRGEREYRIGSSFSYVLVGIAVVAIGILLETV